MLLGCVLKMACGDVCQAFVLMSLKVLSLTHALFVDIIVSVGMSLRTVPCLTDVFGIQEVRHRWKAVLPEVWRDTLTHEMLREYFHPKVVYWLRRMSDVPDPDMRIAVEAGHFTDMLVLLVRDIFENILMLGMGMRGSQQQILQPCPTLLFKLRTLTWLVSTSAFVGANVCISWWPDKMTLRGFSSL